MTGFGGRLERKVWLLEHEASRDPAAARPPAPSRAGQLALGVGGVPGAASAQTA